MSDSHAKPKIATCSLAGCFGCHMSFLDIDERLAPLADLVEFNRSPLTDIKELGPCRIGLIEGGLCNTENVEVLENFREKCEILVSVGACAIIGGIPALRNHFDLKDCLEQSYTHGLNVVDPQIPSDPELPLILDKVHPVHEVVRVDYFLQGCPPPADAFWELLTAVLEGREPKLDYHLRHYD